MPVKFLDDEAIADIAFIIDSDTLEGIFIEACTVLFKLQTDIELLDANLVFPISLNASSYERLLYNVLAEILYYKDAELFFPKSMDIKLFEEDGKFVAKGNFHGTEFNDELHTRGNDIKAITMHDFYLKQIDNAWQAYILIDI